MAMVPGQFVPVPAPEVVALGAVGSVPAGLGIVEGDTIPYTPAALERKKENQKNWLTLRSRDQVLPAGRAARQLHAVSVPDLPEQGLRVHRLRVRGRGAQHLYERPGRRRRPTRGWASPSASGKATRWWSTVTGFNDQTWFDRAGNHHSDSLKVTERWTPQGPDHLWYEATIEDPKTFTRPWKISMPLYRRVEPNAQLMQFKCVEFVEELMYGDLRKKPTAARAAERADRVMRGNTSNADEVVCRWPVPRSRQHCWEARPRSHTMRSPRSSTPTSR